MAQEFKMKQGDTETVVVTAMVGTEVFPLTAFDTEGVMEARLSGQPVAYSVPVAITSKPNGTMSFTLSRPDFPGTYEMVIKLNRTIGGTQKTFPTEGYMSLIIEDNIEGSGENTIELPPTTPAVFGTGTWAWTPSVVDAGVPIISAQVRVISDAGVTLGPATTDVNGQCIASDGLGAFRLDSSSYTLTVTSGAVTSTSRLVIDSSGNGDVY